MNQLTHQVADMADHRISTLSLAQTQRASRAYSEDERRLVSWFFVRLKNIYGSKFDQQWGDEVTLRMAKQEFAPEILKFNESEIDQKFNVLKACMELNPDYAWPSIPKVLALTIGRAPGKTNSKAYEISQPRLPRLRNLEEGKEGIKRLREILQ